MKTTFRCYTAITTGDFDAIRKEGVTRFWFKNSGRESIIVIDGESAHVAFQEKAGERFDYALVDFVRLENEMHRTQRPTIWPGITQALRQVRHQTLSYDEVVSRTGWDWQMEDHNMIAPGNYTDIDPFEPWQLLLELASGVKTFWIHSSEGDVYLRVEGDGLTLVSQVAEDQYIVGQVRFRRFLNWLGRKERVVVQVRHLLRMPQLHPKLQLRTRTGDAELFRKIREREESSA